MAHSHTPVFSLSDHLLLLRRIRRLLFVAMYLVCGCAGVRYEILFQGGLAEELLAAADFCGGLGFGEAGG
jgi:hypothetical protein